MSASEEGSRKTPQKEVPAEVGEGLSYCSFDMQEPPLFLDGKHPEHLAGVYLLYENGELQYIGQTGNVKKRFRATDTYYREGLDTWVVPIASENWRRFVETLLIQQFHPPENKRIPLHLKDDEIPPDSGWPTLESAYPDIQDTTILPTGGVGVGSLAPTRSWHPITGCTMGGLRERKKEKPQEPPYEDCYTQLVEEWEDKKLVNKEKREEVRLERLRLKEEKRVLRAKIKEAEKDARRKRLRLWEEKKRERIRAEKELKERRGQEAKEKERELRKAEKEMWREIKGKKRGNLSKKVGRPLLSKTEGTVAKSITIKESQLVYLKEVGKGNISLGVRIVVDAHKGAIAKLGI